MSAHLCPGDGLPGQPEVHIELNVGSKILWSPEKIASISAALESVSPATAEALRRYRHDPELF